MTVFQLGGKRIVAKATSTYVFFYRRQGLTIQVNPSSHWWCLWQCTSTDKICSIHLEAHFIRDGDVVDEAERTCANCGSVSINGPRQYGWSVPETYQLVQYQGVATIDRKPYPFHGTEFYSTPPR